MSYRCVNTDCPNHTAAFPLEAAKNLTFKCFLCQSKLSEPPLELTTVIDSIDTLPATLQIMPKLQQLLGDINSSMGNIVLLIEKDPTLVSHIVKLSNSAYYSASSYCLTVEEAMNRIGFSEAYKMIGLVASGQVLSDELEIYGLSPDELWEKSVLTATLMQFLSHRSKSLKNYSMPVGGIAYTVGLLHSIGQMLINHYHINTGISALDGLTEKLTPQKEDELLGFDNYEAGALLLQKWNFANDLTRPIKFQDVPEAAGKDEVMASLLSICKQAFADLPRQMIKTQIRTLYKNYEPNAKLMDIAKIEKDDLFEGLTEAVNEYDTLAKSLKD